MYLQEVCGPLPGGKLSVGCLVENNMQYFHHITWISRPRRRERSWRKDKWKDQGVKVTEEGMERGRDGWMEGRREPSNAS